MIELRRVVTRKGQVTVPAEIRRELGLKEGDEVAFLMSDDGVRLTRSTSVVERTAGVFKSRKRALSAEALRDVAERAIADDVVERAGT